jgi:hypothetical protein
MVKCLRNSYVPFQKYSPFVTPYHGRVAKKSDYKAFSGQHCHWPNFFAPFHRVLISGPLGGTDHFFSAESTIFFAKSTFFHAGQCEKKSFFHAKITFFHAGITFFHAAASSVKKSDLSGKKSDSSVKKSISSVKKSTKKS